MGGFGPPLFGAYMSSRIQTNMVELLTNQSITNNTNTDTTWWDVSGWQNKKVIWECDSSGTPSITITAHVSPYPVYYLNNSITPTTEHYYSVTIVSAATGKTMVEYDEDDVAEMGKAWKSVRFNVANGNGAGDVTGGYLRILGDS